MKPSRRDLLRGLAVAGVGAAVLPGCSRVPARNPWPEQPWQHPAAHDPALFPLGAQAGEPSATTLLACAKAPGDTTLTLHHALYVDEAWEERPPAAVTREGDFVRAELDDLPPDTSVALCFVTDDGRRSPVISARTCLEPGQGGEIRLVLNCCDHQRGAPFHALSNVQIYDRIDAHIHLGDAAYCDGAVTVEDFRAIWFEHLKHPGYQDLFAAAAGIYTWDDHEVDNNWEATEIDPAIVAAGLQAMHEHVPLPRDPAHPERLWRKVRFGDVAELFMLDCRGERDRPAGRYISEEQLQWLLDGLKASTATWKLIGNSVPMSRLPTFFSTPVATDDTWHGHGDGAQRQRLLDHIIEEGIEGVLVLSGDYHMPMLSRVEPEGPASQIWEIIGGPGGSTPNPLGLLMDTDPQIPYLDAVRNIIVIDLGSDGLARLRVVDEDRRTRMDATLDVTGELLEITTQRRVDDEED